MRVEALKDAAGCGCVEGYAVAMKQAFPEEGCLGSCILCKQGVVGWSTSRIFTGHRVLPAPRPHRQLLLLSLLYCTFCPCLLPPVFDAPSCHILMVAESWILDWALRKDRHTDRIARTWLVETLCLETPTTTWKHGAFTSYCQTKEAGLLCADERGGGAVSVREQPQAAIIQERKVVNTLQPDLGSLCHFYGSEGLRPLK